MSDESGVEPGWIDPDGLAHSASAAGLLRLRSVLQATRPPAGTTMPVVTRVGRHTGIHGVLELEAGGEMRLDGRVPNDCPPGYHVAHDVTGSRPFIVCPPRCVLPDRRKWGWCAQLYEVRSARSWGIGDLADLRALREWSASVGAGFVLINPLNAVAPLPEQQSCPYFPATRRFSNPIYLRIEDVPGAGRTEGQLAGRGRALNASDVIDRDAVWELKIAALRAIYDRGATGSDFADWRIRQSAALEDFAAWSALTVRFGGSWRRWPTDLRRPDAAGLPAFRRAASADITFWAWLQWLVQRQLGDGPAQVAVVHDLPVGFAPDGFDAWCWQDLLAPGVSIGAPPDRTNPDGQNWGVAPFVPDRLRAAGYQPFIDSIRAAMTRGGGLRIDHIMGLMRLWWVPADLSAADGAYVRYPMDDLFDLLCLESARAQTTVIGEDLGTVDPAVRRAMRRRGVLSSRVLWFEKQDPQFWPVAAVGTVSTHDLPTIAGVWSGSDTADQLSRGVPAGAVTEVDTLRQRLQGLTRMPPAAELGDVLVGVHTALGRAPCLMVGVSLHDGLGVSARTNVPGTAHRVNWSRALPIVLDRISGVNSLSRVATLMNSS